MIIKIANRYLPFSTVPGHHVWIPKTAKMAVVYPGKIFIDDLELKLNLKGPFECFFVQLNLEKGQVDIAGRAQNGVFSFVIKRKKNHLVFHIEDLKAPLEGMVGDKAVIFTKKTDLYLCKLATVIETTDERLSFGVAKKQLAEDIFKRASLHEFLPLWYRMGTFYPFTKSTPSIDMAYDLLEKRPLDVVMDHLLKIFRCRFFDLICPFSYDKHHQNSDLPTDDPLALLTAGQRFIKGLFFKKEQDRLFFLPHLFHKFHAGRITGLVVDDMSISMQWSKKRLKCLHIYTKKAKNIFLEVPNTKTFRINTKRSKLPLKIDQPVALSANRDHFFDRFEK